MCDWARLQHLDNSKCALASAAILSHFTDQAPNYTTLVVDWQVPTGIQLPVSFSLSHEPLGRVSRKKTAQLVTAELTARYMD